MQGDATVRHASKLAQRVARELQEARRQLERTLSDSGNEFRDSDSTSTLETLKASHSPQPRRQAGRQAADQWQRQALPNTVLYEC